MIGFIVLLLFLALVLIGAPIGTSMGVAGLVCLVLDGTTLSVVPYNYYSSLTSFVLLAIPYFILGGAIMEKAGISSRLIRFAQAMVGHIKGGLAIVCVIVCCFFAAICGSGPATVAALGMILIPAMIDVGHDEGSSAALMATAGSIGIIIPPSIVFIVYASITGVSTSDLFMAGIIPGLLMGGLLIAACLITTDKSKLKVLPKASAKERWSAFKDAFWGLLMPVIILGGIYGGIFTATEAAAVSAVYGLFVGVFIYKTLKFRDIIDVFSSACETSGQTMFTIGTAALFAYVLTVSGIAASVTTLLQTVTNGSTVIFLLIVNIILLIAGCFIDGNCCQYIFTPIFYPVCMSLGYSPIALGVVMAMNTAVGMVTPPVGCNLNVVSGVTGIKFKRVVSGVIPYIIAGTIALLLVTYIPSIATFLPDFLNSMKG